MPKACAKEESILLHSYPIHDTYLRDSAPRDIARPIRPPPQLSRPKRITGIMAWPAFR
jgi:hypothetical protein